MQRQCNCLASQAHPSPSQITYINFPSHQKKTGRKGRKAQHSEGLLSSVKTYTGSKFEHINTQKEHLPVQGWLKGPRKQPHTYKIIICISTLAECFVRECAEEINIKNEKDQLLHEQFGLQRTPSITTFLSDAEKQKDYYVPIVMIFGQVYMCAEHQTENIKHSQ